MFVRFFFACLLLVGLVVFVFCGCCSAFAGFCLVDYGLLVIWVVKLVWCLFVLICFECLLGVWCYCGCGCFNWFCYDWFCLKFYWWLRALGLIVAWFGLLWVWRLLDVTWWFLIILGLHVLFWVGCLLVLTCCFVLGCYIWYECDCLLRGRLVLVGFPVWVRLCFLIDLVCCLYCCFDCVFVWVVSWLLEVAYGL